MVMAVVGIGAIGLGVAAWYFLMGPGATEEKSGPPTTKELCQIAGESYLKKQGKTAGRSGVVFDEKGWPWVPPGCSVQSGGDWAIHWNVDKNGKDGSNTYTPITQLSY